MIFLGLNVISNLNFTFKTLTVSLTMVRYKGTIFFKIFFKFFITSKISKNNSKTFYPKTPIFFSPQSLSKALQSLPNSYVNTISNPCQSPQLSTNQAIKHSHSHKSVCSNMQPQTSLQTAAVNCTWIKMCVQLRRRKQDKKNTTEKKIA